MTATGERPIGLRDAVLLAHALVVRCVEEIGGRALVLKGVGAERHGLRGRRTSTDVDVLVPTADLWPLTVALRRRGWAERAVDPDDVAFPVHSLSFTHPAWPCDIDVHFRFPGLEAGADAVFESLWERHDSMRIAERDIAIPDRADCFVVLAVHALRSPWVTRHRLELEELAGLAPGIGIDVLLVAAARLGALACARPLLEPLVRAAAAGSTRSVEWGEVSDEWAVRTGLGDPFARRLLSIGGADWPRRLRLLRAAVLPPREVIGSLAPGRPSGGLQLLRAYLRRWLRGAVAIPRAVLALRRLDRGIRDAARRR